MGNGVHPDLAFALMKDRQRELQRVAERHRPGAAQPGTPGGLPRFALGAAGWGRRPAVVAGRLVLPPAWTPTTV
jgi:hypothetical protein